jgi:two-component sensor histidine kinase
MHAENGLSNGYGLQESFNHDADLLLREITHRVNNEFASAIGLVNVVAARSKNSEVKVALANVGECLHNYARLHHALQVPAGDERVDASVRLRTLCQSISLSKLQCKGIELMFIEHPLQLSAMQCWRLSLILSELITNSCRHAFDDSGGIVRVEILKRGPLVECSVADNGSAREARQPGQGLRIVSSLVRALNGEMQQCFGDCGSVSVISFPHADYRSPG